MSVKFKLIGPEPVVRCTIFTYIKYWLVSFLRKAFNLQIYCYNFMKIIFAYAIWFLIFDINLVGWALCKVCNGFSNAYIFLVQLNLWCYLCLSTPSRARTSRRKTHGRNLHRKMISRGFRYMDRFDQRLLIYSCLQISPVWAAYHHTYTSWLSTVYERAHPTLLILQQYSSEFSKLQNYIFPRELTSYVG